MYEDLENPAAPVLGKADAPTPGLAYGATTYPETADLARAGAEEGAEADIVIRVVDPTERKRFAVKVLTTFSLQLACTTVLILLAKLFIPLELAYSTAGVSIGLSALSVTFLLSFVVACCSKLMRTSPWNWIVLVLYTLLQSITLGWICISFSAPVVLQAATITCFIFGILALVAAFAPIDITSWGPYLLVTLLVLVAFSIVVAVGLLASDSEGFRWAHTGIALGMVLLFSIYVVFDLQLILGGHSHEYSLDDYCFAAVMLYSDVIIIFMRLLDLS